MATGHRLWLLCALGAALCRPGGGVRPLLKPARARPVKPPGPAGGAGGTKRLLAKTRAALLSPGRPLIVVDGTNVLGHHGFRDSEAELLELVRAWVDREPDTRGRVLVCFDGRGGERDGALDPERTADAEAAGGAGSDGSEALDGGVGALPSGAAAARDAAETVGADASAPDVSAADAVAVARAASFGAASADELILRALTLLLQPSTTTPPGLLLSAGRRARDAAAQHSAILVTADRALVLQCSQAGSAGAGPGAGSGRRAVAPVLPVHPTAFASLLRQRARAPRPEAARSAPAPAGAAPALLGKRRSAARGTAPSALPALLSALAPGAAEPVGRRAATPRAAPSMRARAGDDRRARPQGSAGRAAAGLGGGSTGGQRLQATSGVRGGSEPAEPSAPASANGASTPSAAALRALTPRFVAAMFFAGALLGPWLDGYHGAFGVLTYEPHPLGLPDSSGLSVALELPVGLLAPGAAAGGVLRTALWVPPLFGVAGALIGGLYAALDAAAAQHHRNPSPNPNPSLIGSLDAALDAAAARPPPPAARAAVPPEPPAVLTAVGLYTLQYYASGALWAASAPPLLACALLSASAAGLWAAFDGTAVGAFIALLTALGGPAIEVGLLHLPALAGLPDSAAGLYAYADPDLPGLGIHSWIVPVYFAGAPAVGSIARLAKGRGL